jgi:phosphoglycerate dehydrogenase-like enzyme
MKVVLDRDLGEEFVRDLRDTFPSVDVRPAYTIEEQLQEAPETEVHFGELSRQVYLVSKKLRWFHFLGIGFDHIVRKIPEIVEADVVMTNARRTHVIPMAEHAFAMMLAFAHKVPEFIDDQRAHRWETMKYYGRMQELAGTTMGIVAMGDIGRGLAQRAQAFEMDVYGVDIRKMSPPPGVREVWGVDQIDDLMAVSDWLVVTAPLTKETRGMIDAGRLGRLKKGAVVIVISRGSIVEEDALVAVLRSGHIAGAALDATAEEPPAPDSPLWDAPNLLLSPHVSADSPQLWVRRKEIFKENLRRYLAGEPLLNVCDKRAGF